MFTGYTLNVHWMFTGCSLDVHWMFTECSPGVAHTSVKVCTCGMPYNKLGFADRPPIDMPIGTGDAERVVRDLAVLAAGGRHAAAHARLALLLPLRLRARGASHPPQGSVL
jgi:hypothetical protein